jgi:hypothetical protein
VFEMNFKCIIKCQKNSDKKCCVYILMFYVFAKSFHEKPIFYPSCVKKTKISARNKFSKRHFLIFFTQEQKKTGFRETWHAHIECQHVRVKVMFRIFLIFKIIFSGGRRIYMHPRSKVHFRYILPLLIKFNSKSHRTCETSLRCSFEYENGNFSVI